MGKNETEFEKNDRYMSPRYILEPVMRCLGPIGMDPASHPRSIVVSNVAVLLPEYAPATVPGAKHTIFADGLTLDWGGHGGITWLNSPYSDGPKGLKAFLAKCLLQETIALAPVRTGNVYWDKTAGQADVEIRLPRVTHEGEKAHSPFHQMLLYFGDRVEQALALGCLGAVRVHPRHALFRPVKRFGADGRLLAPKLRP